MSKYIQITKEQEERANAVNLEMLLYSQGEALKRSGSEWLWFQHKGVTIRGNEWYSHYQNRGGMAIDFVREFYGLSYPDAVMYLLGLDTPCAPNAENNTQRKKIFALPEAYRNMHRVYPYLMKTRCIAAEVITHFAHARLLYEDSKYHNAVFVGQDEYGVPRHAHKRGTRSSGDSFRANAAGSDPKYSFHHFGGGSMVRVFESPVDMLSYITLHPENWQEYNYVSLCGVSEHALLWMLAQNPNISEIVLQLDNDTAGIEADCRLTDILNGYGHTGIRIEKSKRKDWNDDLCDLFRGVSTQEKSHAYQ